MKFQIKFYSFYNTGEITLTKIIYTRAGVVTNVIMSEYEDNPLRNNKVIAQISRIQ